MNSTTLRNVTGTAGLIGALLTLAELPLYFVYSGPPPDSNVFTRSLLGLAGLTSFIVFMSGIRYLVRDHAPSYEWAGGLAAAAGLMWLTAAFVATGLEVGAVIQVAEPIDPTITVSGTYILYGSISKLLMALFLFAFGVGMSKARLLPSWTARSAYVLAVLQLAFVPSMYFGNDPVDFYAANGWGTTATLGGLMMLWLLAISVSMLRVPGAELSNPDPEPQTIRAGEVQSLRDRAAQVDPRHPGQESEQRPGHG
ncbi:hypothetical protein [Nocardia asteroides]|uniref:hypothetical protein n=1 Tax=Nocardia asteroides TaxID=1824 RepID=UPI001E4EABCF|nr:hypothetical protein [Nocardia asteroides]UGT61826.1 hypothetical protein LTT61_00255 [Nocardia asteroides]